MPGRPVLQRFCKRVDALGGEEFIYSELANGKTYGKLAQLLQVDRRLLYSWRKMTPERMEKCAYYHRLGADVLAEQSVDDLQDLIESGEFDSATVSAARALAQGKRWLAGKQNPEKWGDKQQIEVNVTHADVHIDAMKEVNALKEQWLAERRRLTSGEVVEADFEVEGEEDDDY